MYKTSRTKLASIGMVMVLLLGMLILPVSAEEDNLFTNPEFSITESDGRKTIPGWSLYGTGDIENILTPDDALYDENPNAEGNMFHSTTNGAGIITSDYLALNEDGSSFISVWYKSSSKNAIRFVVVGYDNTDTEVESVNEYLPSTEGVWAKHEYKFSTVKNATKVKVIIRLVDYSEKINGEWVVTGKVEEGNIFCMAPYYTNVIPKVYIPNADFESGSVDGWAFSSSTDEGRGTFEAAQETNGNYYLKITTNGENACRVQGKSSSTELFEHGKTYKLTFKFLPLTEGSTPQLDVFGLNKNGYQVSTLSASIVNLNTLQKDKWTEYVCYITLEGEETTKTEEKRNGKAEMMQFQIRAQGNHVAGYDDFKIELAANNAMIYQNGVETETLVPGTTVSARYHNISAADATFVLARYTTEGDTMRLADVKITSAPKEMTTAAEDVILEITSHASGDIIKAFAFNTSTSLTPETEPSVATVAAASIAD